MSHVATLIADPRAASIPDALVREAAAALCGAAERLGGAAERLGEHAVDLRLEAEPDPERVRAVHADLAAARLDLVVQPRANRRKRLFLADMDSTMIEQECIDELADYVGLKAEVARITERAMRGEIAFEPALRERVALLKGLPDGVVDEIVRDRIRLMAGGRILIATLRAAGAHTCLVSGGFTLFTGPIAAALGFHEHRSNRLVIEDGRLAGRVEEPILGREAKRAALVELRGRLRLAPAETMAVGDGANDLAMLGEAGLGVAFRAKPAVAAAAHARIDFGDLTALLHVQGFRTSDFVR
ncbi:MAG TPA: phosphoserine phosphatase SerB [Beijerinckiaceae bacterium]|nr:phosphoserine phosphatase SerB [Beijerinckiaceae bacterium]